jgi:hypothetical protein
MKNGRLLSRNRSSYRRLLKLESLETRSLMAADISGASHLAAEGELSLPEMGFMPIVPAELVNWPRQEFASNASTSPSNNVSPSNAVAMIPLTDAFRLHSRPTATKTIYLDFDGFTAVGTTWNQRYGITSIVSPAYDPAGNGPEFTDAELMDVRDAWQRVAADFAPFDVNVTTEDPGEANLVNEGGTDERWGIRNVITLDNFSGLPIGGFAFFNSFSWGYESAGASDTPAYVFNPGSIGVSATVSHETGHSIGLTHDGTTAANPVQPSAEYYNGHGTGENSWGPIMGSGFFSNVTTWDNGTYIGTSNGTANANRSSGPSDLDVITTQNGFGYITDDHANTRTSATQLIGTSLPNGFQSISSFGTISETTDVDFFRFQTGSGPVNITIDPYVNEVWTSDGRGGFVRSLTSSLLDSTFWSQNQGSNLDVEATIYDSAGNVVAVSNPDGLRASFTNLGLNVGTYYLRVDGAGFGNPQANSPTGYSEYVSLGQYQITGTIASSIDIQILSSSSYTENTAPEPVAPDAIFSSFNINSFAGAALRFSIATNYQASDRLDFVSTGTAAGQVSFVGNDVSYGGVLIGRVSPGVQTRTVTFNAAATVASIQAVIRSLTFEHTTDSPLVAPRDVTMFLDNGNNGVSNLAVARVVVVPVNDSPLMEDVSLSEVLEDTQDPAGARISTTVTTGFLDVDQNAVLSGIAVTANPALASEGVWEYSTDRTVWVPVGTVSPTTSLLLSRNTWIRFKPASNFDAVPAPLSIRGIDETYLGAFSTRTVRTRFDVTQAVVNGPFSLSDTLLDTRVTPVNDAPVAQVGPRSDTVNEDSPLTFNIDSAWFTDVDNPNDMLLSVVQSDGQELPLWLTLNALTGVLSGTPTNDNVGVFNFVIRSSDPAGLTAEIPLSLTVVNTNDTPTGVVLVGNNITENTSNVFVGTLFGSDPDSTDTVSFSTTDSRFQIRGNQLFVAPGQSIDFENTQSIQLSIGVTDTAGASIDPPPVIVINVINVNEFAPALMPTTIRIPENQPAASSAGTLLAPDGDAAQRVRYRFVGTPPTMFTLNSETGMVSLKTDAALNFETTDSYQFFVEAIDNGAPQKATTASVNVVIEDVNEYAPVIATQSINLSESQPPDFAFATIQATDLDVRQALVYSLVAPETRFAINATTGALSLIRGALFDYEQANTTTLKVRVTDPGGRFTEQVVTVNVLDANDPPTSASIPTTSLLANVTGIDLGLIAITDQDSGQAYSIQSLDDRFVVQNGRLLLAPGKSISESDPANVVIPLIVRELGTNGLSYPLSINISRISNPTPWQNPINPLDVDGSGGDKPVDPLDVLALVNAINGNRQGALPSPRPLSTFTESFYDVDGDGSLNPLDVLAVVNFINDKTNVPPSGSEGEGADLGSPNSFPLVWDDKNEQLDASGIWLAAFNQLEEERQGTRRRRS